MSREHELKATKPVGYLRFDDNDYLGISWAGGEDAFPVYTTPPDAAKRISELEKALKSANNIAEEFERKYYLLLNDFEELEALNEGDKMSAKDLLLPALRQHRHNYDSEDFISAYDYDETNKIFSKLEAENKTLKSQLNSAKTVIASQDKHISTVGKQVCQLPSLDSEREANERLTNENEALKARIANGVRVVADEIIDGSETYWDCYKEVERQELLNATLIFDDDGGES